MASKTNKSPMAVNKSQTPAWMRIVIIAVVISFVAGGVVIVAAGFSGGGGTGETTSTVGTDSITAEFKPRVDAAVAGLQAKPDDPNAIVAVGNAYYDWAAALYNAQQQQAAVPYWVNAVTYYDQALAIQPDNDQVLGDKAFALAYGGDSRAQAALQAFISAASDNAQLAQQVETAKSLLSQVQSSQTTTTP